MLLSKIIPLQGNIFCPFQSHRPLCPAECGQDSLQVAMGGPACPPAPRLHPNSSQFCTVKTNISITGSIEVVSYFCEKYDASIEFSSKWKAGFNSLLRTRLSLRRDFSAAEITMKLQCNSFFFVQCNLRCSATYFLCQSLFFLYPFFQLSKVRGAFAQVKVLLYSWRYDLFSLLLYHPALRCMCILNIAFSFWI